MVVAVPSEKINNINRNKESELNKLGESQGRAHILKLPLSSWGALFPNSLAKGSIDLLNSTV